MDYFDLQIQTWACPQCTFLNESHPYLCEMCGFQDEKEYHIQNRGQSRQTLDKWQRIEAAFHKRDRILLPVLSCHSLEQFQKNITLLVERWKLGHIQGAWLTSANVEIPVLESAVRWSKATYPEFWVGINLIGETFVKALQFLERFPPDGLWMDKSYVSEDELQTVPILIQDQFARLKWNGLYFGGVLFKYQQEKGDPVKICLNAIPWMDVLCTSGIATGIPITPEKLNCVANTVAGAIPIAIASGVSEHNVADLFGQAHIYLFRESVVFDDEDLDVEKLDALIAAAAT